jgi:FkbH-like protein
LRALRCFDSPALTEEDRARAASYRIRREGADSLGVVASVDEWLRTLETEIQVERLGPVNLPRASQLLNKTNQMNLSTRRLPETELARWAEQSDREFWTFRVSDRFGSHGITGLLGLERLGDSLEIVDFVMSCRVLGRNVERSILSWAVRRAGALGCRRLQAEILPTGRNRPCVEFFSGSGMTAESDLVFILDVAADYATPEGVTLLEPASTI